MSMITLKVNEKQQRDLVELKTRTMLKPIGRVRRPRIRKRDPNHIPRPVNSFLAYRTEMQAIIRNYCPLANHREISKIVAKWWHDSTNEEKQVFKDKAEMAKSIHAQMYPDYKFNPKKKKINHSKKSSNEKPQETKTEPVDMMADLTLLGNELEKDSQLIPCMFKDQGTQGMMTQDIYANPFKFDFLEHNQDYKMPNSNNNNNNNDTFQDYVLINDQPSLFCYNTPMMSFYDLTPTTQPLLSPEEDFMNLTSAAAAATTTTTTTDTDAIRTTTTTVSSLSPYLISTDNCWHNQLRYF
ncbi:unnamed protein product [Rhizopus stolonifer]